MGRKPAPNKVTGSNTATDKEPDYESMIRWKSSTKVVPGVPVLYDEPVPAKFNSALTTNLPPDDVFLSDAWKAAVAGIDGAERHRRWPLNFESHGKIRNADLGYEKPAITQSNDVDYYIRAFGNVQLHGTGERMAGLDRLTPSKSSAKGNMQEKGDVVEMVSGTRGAFHGETSNKGAEEEKITEGGMDTPSPSPEPEKKTSRAAAGRKRKRINIRTITKKAAAIKHADSDDDDAAASTEGEVPAPKKPAPADTITPKAPAQRRSRLLLGETSTASKGELAIEKKKARQLERYCKMLEAGLKDASKQYMDVAGLLRRSLRSAVDIQITLQALDKNPFQNIETACAD